MKFFIHLVMQTLVSKLFGKEFLDEIFKSQNIWSKKGIHEVFFKMITASQIKLDKVSKDKVRKSRK